MENPSLSKLKAIVSFLEGSSVNHFTNYNLKIFLKYIEDTPEISGIIESLLVQHEHLAAGVDTLINTTRSSNAQDCRSNIDSFEGSVAFSVYYLKKSFENGLSGMNIVRFYYGGSPNQNNSAKDKDQFMNDCIHTILMYLELQISHSTNAIYILQRYKVLCEWYDRQHIYHQKEVDITKVHLSRYLFDQGFTYSLSETNVPSGRIDNLALNLGFRDKKELSSLPDAIVVEAKIFNGNKRAIVDVKNQALTRAMELNFREVYCVIFNKTSKHITIENADMIKGISFLTEGNVRIGFIVVNLDNSFYESTVEIDEVSINLN